MPFVTLAFFCPNAGNGFEDSDSLQSAAGYLMFADKRMELGGHLRKLPMGYFTSGNIGKISSVLSTDMVFIEEVAMSTLGNMMS